MTPWLLIPVKALDSGKSRLRTVLADDTRRALNEFFLRRMLATAQQFPGSARTAVISECDRVLQIAAACGVQTVRQTSGPGLNRAASEGMAKVRRRGARAVLLIAADLPTLRPCDLRELADSARRGGGIVICPDKHRTGTNAILLPRDAHLRFRFGKGSFLGHCSEAMRAGFPPIVHFNARVAFDVDSPQDLVLWPGARGLLAGARATNA
ncbi:MAG: 2-phospho-L-lactate guanylyltransferase [Betaproteobacteria bacterium RIFCSPLOWO2_12_FULL_66_14]|nr:MAG: 2-phospho-L-lactate guanylyltransferase [Betaproteobacteria bacterium RIFCSPLOWO2_12_FULL_66_14]